MQADPRILRRLKLRELETLRAVCQAGSMAKAAIPKHLYRVFADNRMLRCETTNRLVDVWRLNLDD